jgi:hypothetical protein
MNDTVVDRPFTPPPPPRSSPSRKFTPDEVHRRFRPIAPFSDRKLRIEDVTSNDDFKAALSLFSISREKKRLCDSESNHDEHAHKKSKQTYEDNRFDTIEEANLYCDKIDAIGIYKSTDDMYVVRQTSDKYVSLEAIEDVKWLYVKCFYAKTSTFVMTNISDSHETNFARGSLRMVYRIANGMKVQCKHFTCNYLDVEEKERCRNCANKHKNWNKICIKGRVFFSLI